MIREYGLGKHNGADYTATVYEGESTGIDQKTLDAAFKARGLPSQSKAELVAKALVGMGFSKRWVREHTKRTPYVAAKTDLIVKTVVPSPKSKLQAV